MGKRRTPEQIETIRSLRRQGMTLSEIEDTVGINRVQVCVICKGIPFVRKPRKDRKEFTVDRAAFTKDYVAGRTYPELKAKYGLSDPTIPKLLRAWNVPFRNKIIPGKKRSPNKPIVWTYELRKEVDTALEAGFGVTTIARRLDLSIAGLTKYVKENEIDKKAKAASFLSEERPALAAGECFHMISSEPYTPDILL